MFYQLTILLVFSCNLLFSYELTPTSFSSSGVMGNPLPRITTDIQKNEKGNQEAVQVNLPLKKNLFTSARIKKMNFQTKDFYQTDFSLSHFKKKDNKNTGFSMTIGSASNKSLSNEQDLTYTGVYFSNKDKWSYFLYLSNNSPLVNFFPIPGFSYQIKRSNSDISLGIPSSRFSYQHSSTVSSNLTLLGYFYHFYLAYRPSAKRSIKLGSKWQVLSYLMSERTIKKERYFIERKKVYLEVAQVWQNKYFTSIEVGNFFDTKSFNARDFSSGNIKNLKSFQNASYIKSSLGLAFF